MTASDPANWSCQIGEVPRSLLPDDADWPMREAVRRAYRELTGREPHFVFSGWGSELSDIRREITQEAWHAAEFASLDRPEWSDPL